MTEKRAVTTPSVPARAAWVAVCVSFGLASYSVFHAAGEDELTSVALALAFFVFTPVGALIRARVPDNRIGPLLVATGLVANAAFAGDAYVVTEPALPGRAFVALAAQACYSVTFALILITLQLFPTGRPLSRRWRAFAWFVVALFGFIVASVSLTPGPLADFKQVINPIGLEPMSAYPIARGGYAWQLLPVAAIGTVVAMGLRFRRSTGEQRLQMKWCAFAAFLLGIALLVLPTTWTDEGPTPLANALLAVGVASIPSAIGAAILRYRLYDIDIVIGKTIVYGALAAFVTVVYVAMVAGLGALVGGGGDRNGALSVVATLTIALAFQPVRAWLQRRANRLVYGERATPYEVLAHLSEQVAHVAEPSELLQRMLATLGRATGAASASLTWTTPDGETELASWVSELPGDGAPHRFPIRHEGVELGALLLTKPADDPLSDEQEQLARELASQAGLVLRNGRLTADLLASVEEVRLSRQRLMRAQDDESRRIERDLREGASRQLGDLRSRLETLARTIEPETAKGFIAEIAGDTSRAIETLHDFARGIYPSVLEAEGLPAAIAAQAARHSAEVVVDAQAVGRYDRDAEVAVYFCILEALQNIAKYAQARFVTVTLTGGADRLTFQVRDDGVGFDRSTSTGGSGTRNMADRLATLGGEIEIVSVPGEGTTVRGSIPAKAAALQGVR